MGTVPNLTDETPLDQYTATASQTEFTFTFMIFATSDIKVYVNDVLKTETTDYVVKQADLSAIVPADDLPMDGGKIVFNSGLTVSDAVSISREIPINRLSGWSNAGAFRANVLNTELTRMQAINQQLERDIARCIRLSPSDAEGGSLDMPTGRANNYLAFDASGNLIVSAGTIGTTPITVSSFAETLLDDANAAAARTTLGAQTQDDELDTLAALSSVANLTALAGLTGAADKIPYFTGVGTMGISHLPSNRNLAINGQGAVAQMGTTFTAATPYFTNDDDSYCLDQMILLSDGNDIVDVSQETTEVPEGAYSSIKFDVETANKQFAYFQPIEAKEAAKIIGGVGSLSFKMKKGGSNATLETFRAAIISWSSTADSITSDVIGTWAGAGTDPTLASNWTYENTPSNLTLTTSFQTFKIENVSIDTASTTNVGILIWCDDTDATVGDIAYLGDIQLEEGAIATPYEQRDFKDELQRSQRFFNKSFPYATRPDSNTGDNGVLPFLSPGNGSGQAYGIFTHWQFPVTMRIEPSISRFTPRASNTSGNAMDITNSGVSTELTVANDSMSDRAALFSLAVQTNMGNAYGVHATASAQL